MYKSKGIKKSYSKSSLNVEINYGKEWQIVAQEPPQRKNCSYCINICDEENILQIRPSMDAGGWKANTK